MVIFYCVLAVCVTMIANTAMILVVVKSMLGNKVDIGGEEELSDAAKPSLVSRVGGIAEALISTSDIMAEAEKKKHEDDTHVLHNPFGGSREEDFKKLAESEPDWRELT